MVPIDKPDKIGRYSVLRELGRGGMGIVWLARDPFIGRHVAIKTTLSSPPKDPKKLEKFYSTFFIEARAAGNLTHPNIVYVYDAAVESDHCYLVLEYVDGPTLKDYCRGEKLLPIKSVINIIYQCAKGLYYAHRKGVVHRDIKPGNIMISKKKSMAKLCDFGIAALEGLGDDAKSDAAMTLGYASPEQLAHKLYNHQTDIFSLGVVMYELLTGHKPFSADTEIGIVYKTTNEPPTPLTEYRDDVPDELERILNKALEKDMTRRYQNGQELAQDLSSYFASLKTVEKKLNKAEKHHALMRLDFFKEFTAAELDEVATISLWVDFPDNAPIISEGAVQDCFYIIVSGGVKISKRGTVLAELGPGDYFGEMAYLGKTSRTADAHAVGHTILMRVDPTVIDEASVNTQLRFSRIFIRTLIQRLAQTTELVTT